MDALKRYLAQQGPGGERALLLAMLDHLLATERLRALGEAERIRNELRADPPGLEAHLPAGWSEGYRAGWCDATAQYHIELRRLMDAVPS